MTNDEEYYLQEIKDAMEARVKDLLTDLKECQDALQVNLLTIVNL